MNPRITVTLLILLPILLAGCSGTPTDSAPAATDQELLAALQSNPGQALVEDLSDLEIEDLVFMREEEKLARDVYLSFAGLYDLAIFDNIAQSEQVHMNKLLVLLDRYGIEDPVGDNPVGIFGDPDLQALYDQLTQQGATDLIAALSVGAAIEEIDILDLVEAMETSTHLDIDRVYDRLMAGSENHLRGFVRELDLQGVTYEPQYLSPEDYQAILDGEHIPGGGGNQHGQGGGNGQNGNNGGGNGGQGGNGGGNG